MMEVQSSSSESALARFGGTEQLAISARYHAHRQLKTLIRAVPLWVERSERERIATNLIDVLSACTLMAIERSEGEWASLNPGELVEELRRTMSELEWSYDNESAEAMRQSMAKWKEVLEIRGFPDQITGPTGQPLVKVAAAVLKELDVSQALEGEIVDSLTTVLAGCQDFNRQALESAENKVVIEGDPGSASRCAKRTLRVAGILGVVFVFVTLFGLVSGGAADLDTMQRLLVNPLVYLLLVVGIVLVIGIWRRSQSAIIAMLLHAPISIVLLLHWAPVAAVFPSLILIPVMVYCVKGVRAAETMEQLSTETPELSLVQLDSQVWPA